MWELRYKFEFMVYVLGSIWAGCMATLLVEQPILRLRDRLVPAQRRCVPARRTP